MHLALISYLTILHRYTQSTWTKVNKVRVWEQSNISGTTPSGSRLSDLDSDSDGDCEVPSSCIEELKLQIPEPVLTTAHFVDLEEHQFRLQMIEVLISVFWIHSWNFIIVLISGWNLLGWSWWFSPQIPVFAGLPSIHELEKCPGCICIKTGWKNRGGINATGKLTLVYLFPNPDDNYRIPLSHIPKTHTMQYPKCDELSSGHERLLPRLQSLMLWSIAFDKNIWNWFRRAWGRWCEKKQCL